MAAEWAQVHKRSWIYLVFITLYGGFVEAIFGLVGVVAVLVIMVNLLPFVGLQVVSREMDMHLKRDLMRGPWREKVLSIFLLFVETAGAGLFAWWGLRGTWACVLDALCPAIIYEGRVDEVKVHLAYTGSTGIRYWLVTAGGKTWQIPCAATDRWDFEKKVTPGREIRAKYLRGSEEITQLWVK